MNSPHAPGQQWILPIASLAIVAALVAAGWWLWKRAGSGAGPPAIAVPTPSASPTAPATPSPLAAAPPGYRLAGVAVGEPVSFAVIEDPDGVNTLYRADTDIPGLGRLVRIDAERVRIEGERGAVELWLAPGATPTATRTRLSSRRTPWARRPPAEATSVPPAVATPTQPPVPGASTPGSGPSDGRD